MPSQTGLNIEVGNDFMSGLPSWTKTSAHFCTIVIEQVPELADPTATSLESSGSDINSLWFQHHNRGDKVSFYGKNKHPDAVFYWKTGQLFEFRARDISRLAWVVRLR